MPLPAHMLPALPNHISGACTCFHWNLELQSSDAHFRPISDNQWLPSSPRVRPTAIPKVSSWRFLPFRQRRPPALARGLLSSKWLVLLCAVHLAPAANLCGMFGCFAHCAVCDFVLHTAAQRSRVLAVDFAFSTRCSGSRPANSISPFIGAFTAMKWVEFNRVLDLSQAL
jgi:hypothetical protein